MATEKVAIEIRRQRIRRAYPLIGMNIGAIFGVSIGLLSRSPVWIPVGMIFGFGIGLSLKKMQG